MRGQSENHGSFLFSFLHFFSLQGTSYQHIQLFSFPLSIHTVSTLSLEPATFQLCFIMTIDEFEPDDVLTEINRKLANVSITNLNYSSGDVVDKSIVRA